VDAGFGNSIYWTLPVVTTIIHFTTLQHINQRLYLLSSVFRTVLPGTRSSLPSVWLQSWLIGSMLNSGHWTPELSLLSLILRPTVSRQVCLGIKHTSGAYDQIFITLRQLRVCWYGALSLTTVRVCRLQLLLVLDSVVFLGSESLGTRDQILLCHIWDFSFRRLPRLAGSRWRYSAPPPHGWNSRDTFFRSLGPLSSTAGLSRDDTLFKGFVSRFRCSCS
jgi:hypothetical protein